MNRAPRRSPPPLPPRPPPPQPISRWIAAASVIGLTMAAIGGLIAWLVGGAADRRPWDAHVDAAPSAPAPRSDAVRSHRRAAALVGRQSPADPLPPPQPSVPLVLPPTELPAESPVSAVAGEPDPSEAKADDVAAALAKLPPQIALCGGRGRGMIDVEMQSEGVIVGEFPGAVTDLDIAIAAPTAPARMAVRLRPQPPWGWVVTWRSEARTLDGGESPEESVAEIDLEDGRLAVRLNGAASPEAERYLACCVILLRPVETATAWRPLRLVEPVSTAAVDFEAFDPKGFAATVPLPPPFAGAGPPDGCRIVVGVGGERAELLIDARAAHQRPAAGMIPVAELGDMARLLLEVSCVARPGGAMVVEASPVLEVAGSPVAVQPAVWESLKRLARQPDAEKERLLKGWNRVVQQLSAIPLDRAAAQVGLIDATIAAPLPNPPGLPLGLEPIGESLGRFLAGAEMDMPPSLVAWQEDCHGVLQQSLVQGPAALRGAWQESYAGPLEAWWPWYAAELKNRLDALAAAAADVASQRRQLRVESVALDADGPDGTSYPVTLVVPAADERPGDARQPRPID